MPLPIHASQTVAVYGAVAVATTAIPHAAPVVAATATAPPVPASPPAEPEGVESGYAWFRLAIAMLISTIGGVGMWSVVVALPAVQAEFGVARGGASLPYTLHDARLRASAASSWAGWSDRFGIIVPLVVGGTVDARRSATSPPAYAHDARGSSRSPTAC